MKKLFENWRKQINEMEYEPGGAVADIESSMDDLEQDLYPGADERGDPDNWDHHYDEDDIGGRFDDMFDRGQPGNDFAEAVARELLLDEESDFEALIQAIKDGLDSWYGSMERNRGVEDEIS